MSSILRKAAAALLIAAAVWAQEPEIVVSRAVVPAIGNAWGFAGVHWHSDVALYNGSAEEVTVVVSPLPDPERFEMHTLEPGGSMIFLNVAADSFGLSGVTPMLIQTLAPQSVYVAATAYGVLEGRLTPPQIIPVLYSPLTPGLQRLSGLAHTPLFRSNVGLVNLGETAATFTVALQRLEGRNLATKNITVEANSSIHIPLNELFPLITEGDDLAVLVDTPAPATYAYGSVVHNETHEARFVQPYVVFR